jgi:hypothetical protein
MARIAAMPCICCRMSGQTQTSKTYVHHIREGRQARNDYLTLPFCYECHQGRLGVHGDKSLLAILKMSEFDLLAEVIKEL